MCDYPFFIPQVVLFANSSLFWFKVTNEHREFRNYLILYDVLVLKETPFKKSGSTSMPGELPELFPFPKK